MSVSGRRFRKTLCGRPEKEVFRMKRSRLVSLAALVLAVCLAMPVFSLAEGNEEYLVQDFTLKDQYGNTHSLSDYSGKTVLLNFWATWCYWCVKEMPDLETIYHENGDNAGDVVILGIAAPGTHDPQVDEAGIISFLEENKITYPVLMDTTGALFDTYVSEGYPTTLIIRPDGYLMYYIPGALSKEDFDTVLQETRNAVPAKQE